MFDLTPYDRAFARFLPENFFSDWMWNRRGSFDTDVKELDSCFVVEANLPGVKLSDISVDYANRCLTVTARQDRREPPDESAGYLKQERFTGEMRRSFYFDNVNPEGITAGLNDGVLKVTLPKDIDRAGVRRSIPINRAGE